MTRNFWRPLTPVNNYQQEDCCFWENFFTEEEINLLLARPEWCAAIQGEIIHGIQNKIDEKVRVSKISWLYPEPELESIWLKINDLVNEVNRRFFHFELTGFYEALQLSIYSSENEGHYNWHTDAAINTLQVPRKLSMSILLSHPNEFEGGELQIKSQTDNPITLECKRGRAWFFPSYTLHRVAPVTKGIRRSLVLWIGGPPFK